MRWTTPVIQFCRTTTEDFTLRGQTIRAGQSLCLFYPSANRDEEIFPDGDVFRIDRQPNDHVGFGRGEHVCLGAHLARLEIRAVFEELRTAPRARRGRGPDRPRALVLRRRHQARAAALGGRARARQGSSGTELPILRFQIRSFGGESGNRRI